MGAKTWVVIAALDEDGTNWNDNTDRILEYFATSTKHAWTRAEARKISWCTYFAHWVLVQAGVSPLPAAGSYTELLEDGGAVGRFLKDNPATMAANEAKLAKDKTVPGKTTSSKYIPPKTVNGAYNYHSVGSKTYTPTPGDLYYRPKHNNHVGVIVGVSGDTIWSVDGNSGPPHGAWDARFFISYDHGKPVKLIGDGFVLGSRKPHALDRDDFYIEIPD